MNTMMEKLALAAGGSHYPGVNTRQLEKFYQLVVAECAQLVSNKIDPAILLDHFGVSHEQYYKTVNETSWYNSST